MIFFLVCLIYIPIMVYVDQHDEGKPLTKEEWAVGLILSFIVGYVTLPIFML